MWVQTLIDQLEDLYRKKLVIEEPANSWQKVATSKRHAWRLWLFIFAGLVVGPIAAVVYFWEPFSSAITHLTTAGTGTISLAGVAAVSLPALLYAWLLKNVSRVFIQTLNLADDAAHRRALAVTYLGLAENPKIELSEAERAIILNALFRPIPTQAGDEGPPAGLVDLIRGKNP
jgi:Na+/phosphate symporter